MKGGSEMKKLLSLLIGVALIVGVAGVAGAVTYTEDVQLDTWLSGSGSISWLHNTPIDLSVPPDTVNSATLTIGANYVNGNNDQVYAEAIALGTLTNGVVTWTNWFAYSASVFDATSIFSTWGSGDNFDVTLNYNEVRAGLLYLDFSRLALNYDNGVAVPEPATMLLLGLGLLGVAVIRRFKKEI